MTDPVAKLAAAEVEATLARERLSATLGELQVRLNPRTLARKALRDVTEAGNLAAKVGSQTARENPGAVAGLVAMAGLFLARHRIAGLFRRKPSGVETTILPPRSDAYQADPLIIRTDR